MPSLSYRAREVKRSKDVEDFPRAFTLRLHPYPHEKRNAVERKYKYKLDDCKTLPPRQTDPLMAYMIQQIRKLSRENMYFAGTKLRVWNVTSSPPIWPVTGKNAQCDVKLYAFGERYNEFPMTIPVSVVDRTASLYKRHNVVVRIAGEWIPFEDWLLRIPDRKILRGDNDKLQMYGVKPKSAIITQQIW